MFYVTYMLAELRRRSGRTVVLGTHDATVAGRAGRLINMQDGRLRPASDVAVGAR